MADRLTASEIEQLTGPDVLARPRYTLAIDAVDYASRIIKFGKVKWQLCNRHPKVPGKLLINAQSLVLDNRDGVFAIGSANGPWATEKERQESTVIAIMYIGSPRRCVHSFTGAVRSIMYQDNGTVVLEIEHPLKMAHDRRWKREDSSSDFNTTSGQTIGRDLTE